MRERGCEQALKQDRRSGFRRQEVPMLWRPVWLLLGSIALAGCATTQVSSFDPELVPGAGGRDVLFAADLVRAHASTVYEAIVEVRPDFFDRRAALGLRGVPESTRVFVNGVDMGDIDALRTLPLGPVTSVRYIEAGDAEFRWAHGINGAAIVVTTAK
jgi:hypothetical protein